MFRSRDNTRVQNLSHVWKSETIETLGIRGRLVMNYFNVHDVERNNVLFVQRGFYAII